jgi:serine/threonine protein kinase
LSHKKYKTKKVLGEGGYGFVYLVHDDFGRSFAMKVLNISTKEQLESVRKEIEVMVSTCG